MTRDGANANETPASAAVQLAQEIRRLRKAAGLSQPELAGMIGYTREYISMAERIGKNVPSQDLVRALDRALAANGALITLREHAKAEQAALRQSASSANRHSEAVPGEGMLMATADESAQFLSWAESTNVGDLTVEQMHSDIRWIAHSYLKVTTTPLFARTKTLRDRTFTLLAGHQDPRHARELYAAAGWSLTVLAWMSVDLGHPDAAEQHARAAWLCAERADYNGLRAWVRATQHTAAFWQDDYTAAANYAEDGLRYTGTGTAELFLSTALALDLARAGDAEHATTALHHAQGIAETAQRAEDELAGPFTCSIDRAGSLWSDTQLALGEAEEALEFANRAVARFEATPSDRRNLGSERMTRLQQVKAHLRLGDLAEAESALSPVLDTAPQHRVRPLLHRVAEVGALVTDQNRATSTTARRIRDAVTDFHRDTVVKQLTNGTDGPNQ